jgi:hypothetical protein
VLHRPLGQAACAEALRLCTGAISPHPPMSAAPVWIDASDTLTALRGLLDAVLSGAETPLASPRGLLLAGTGSLEGLD